MDKVTEAAIEYLKRKERILYPSGRTEKGDRWYPDNSETVSCCSYCRSLKHVCKLYNVKEKEVRFMLSKKGLPLLIGSGDPWVDKYLESKMKGV